MINNRYKTAAAFRKALEDRLQAMAERERLELQRLRRKAAPTPLGVPVEITSPGSSVIKEVRSAMRSLTEKMRLLVLDD